MTSLSIGCFVVFGKSFGSLMPVVFVVTAVVVSGMSVISVVKMMSLLASVSVASVVFVASVLPATSVLAAEPVVSVVSAVSVGFAGLAALAGLAQKQLAVELVAAAGHQAIETATEEEGPAPAEVLVVSVVVSECPFVWPAPQVVSFELPAYVPMCLSAKQTVVPAALGSSDPAVPAVVAAPLQPDVSSQ